MMQNHKHTSAVVTKNITHTIHVFEECNI